MYIHVYKQSQFIHGVLYLSLCFDIILLVFTPVKHSKRQKNEATVHQRFRAPTVFEQQYALIICIFDRSYVQLIMPLRQPL